MRVQLEYNQVRRTFCQRKTWQVTLQTQLIVSTLIYFYQIWTLTTQHYLTLYTDLARITPVYFNKQVLYVLRLERGTENNEIKAEVK